ncbi:DUF4321 domain-containing protein [Ruminococcus sp. FC2018]|jgi:hypothetical protein|uniref:DUF4321 domain-containing protein n=1 Tax=Ruminococcus sp. FC2018 TaxID=1410617 RepID=UPI00048BB262|nr:DUF4321 domain-containing protein [Ruminococcus sp. FC2018]
MKNFKKTFAFIFFILAGIILGAFIAYVCEGKDYVGWLAWGKKVGLENISVDLYVIKLDFGFMVKATISQIFTIAAALIVFSKTCKNL